MIPVAQWHMRPKFSRLRPYTPIAIPLPIQVVQDSAIMKGLLAKYCAKILKLYPTPAGPLSIGHPEIQNPNTEFATLFSPGCLLASPTTASAAPKTLCQYCTLGFRLLRQRLSEVRAFRDDCLSALKAFHKKHEQCCRGVCFDCPTDASMLILGSFDHQNINKKHTPNWKPYVCLQQGRAIQPSSKHMGYCQNHDLSDGNPISNSTLKCGPL